MSFSICKLTGGRTLYIKAINGSMLSTEAIKMSKHEEIYKITVTHYVNLIFETNNDERLSYEEKVAKAKSYHKEYMGVYNYSSSLLWEQFNNEIKARNLCNG